MDNSPRIKLSGFSLKLDGTDQSTHKKAFALRMKGGTKVIFFLQMNNTHIPWANSVDKSTNNPEEQASRRKFDHSFFFKLL